MLRKLLAAGLLLLSTTAFADIVGPPAGQFVRNQVSAEEARSGFWVSTGTVRRFTITSLSGSVGQCLTIGVGGLISSGACGGGGSGPAGQIVASPQFSLGFYSGAGSTDTISGDSLIVTNGSGLLTTGGLTVATAPLRVKYASAVQFETSTGADGGLIYNPVGANERALTIAAADGVGLGSVNPFTAASEPLITADSQGFAIKGSSANLAATYSGFKGTTNVDASTLWTLPKKDGTSGQVLSTDGSGQLSFATITGSGGGGDNFGNHTATKTISAPYGLSVSTISATIITVTSGTISSFTASTIAISGITPNQFVRTSPTGTLYAAAIASADIPVSFACLNCSQTWTASQTFASSVTVASAFLASSATITNTLVLTGASASSTTIDVQAGNIALALGGSMVIQPSSVWPLGTHYLIRPYYNGFDTSVEFYTPGNSTGSDTPLMTMRSFSHRIGIGTTSPTATLDVPGGTINAGSVTVTSLMSGQCVQADSSGGLVSAGAPCGSGGGGGGSSTLQVTYEGAQITSPTASLNFGYGLTVAAVGSTATIKLNENTTSFIHNQTTQQTPTAFFVDSGTINAQMIVKGVSTSTTSIWAQAGNIGLPYGNAIVVTPDASLVQHKLIETGYTGATDFMRIFTPGNASTAAAVSCYATGRCGVWTELPSSEFDVNGQLQASSVLPRNLTASRCVKTDVDGTLISAAADCGTSGGGGSSSLEIFSGAIVSSPTVSINPDSNSFSAVMHGSTFYFTLNPATTNFIHNQRSIQSSAAFNVSSGAITQANTTGDALIITSTGSGHGIALKCQGTAGDGLSLYDGGCMNIGFPNSSTMLSDGLVIDYSSATNNQNGVRPVHLIMGQNFNDPGILIRKLGNNSAPGLQIRAAEQAGLELVDTTLSLNLSQAAGKYKIVTCGGGTDCLTIGGRDIANGSFQHGIDFYREGSTASWTNSGAANVVLKSTAAFGWTNYAGSHGWFMRPNDTMPATYLTTLPSGYGSANQAWVGDGAGSLTYQSVHLLNSTQTVTAGTTFQGSITGSSATFTGNTTMRGGSGIIFYNTSNSSTAYISNVGSASKAEVVLVTADGFGVNALPALYGLDMLVGGGPSAAGGAPGTYVGKFGRFAVVGSSADGNFTYSGFTSTNNVTTSKLWVLPRADGTSGQYLKTDGSGNLDWGTDASGGSGVSVYPATATASFPYGLSASTIAVNGSGDGEIILTIYGSTYTVASSSVIPTVGHFAVYTSTWGTLGDGGTGTVGGSGGGDSFGSHVATKTITAGYGIVATTVSGTAFVATSSSLTVIGASGLVVENVTANLPAVFGSSKNLGSGAILLNSAAWVSGILSKDNMPVATAYEDEVNTFTSSQTVAAPLGLNVTYEMKASSANISTGLIIPNGSGPTVDAVGKIAIDTTNGQLLAHDGVAVRVVGVSTHSFTVTISSAGWNGQSKVVWRAPNDMSVTINKVMMETMQAGTTVLFQLDETTFGGTASAGTDVFTVAYASATNTGNTLTGFTNASIAAGASLIFNTPAAGAAGGSPQDVTFTVYYTKDRT